MFDLRPILHPSFWFSFHPSPLMASSSRLLLVGFTLFIVVGIVIRVVGRRKAPSDRFVLETFYKVSRLLSTLGLLGLLWLFFAVEEVTFLQARYWMLVWFVGLLVWVFFIWRFVSKTVPAERARRNESRERNKYLPGRNRR